ncbi:hypothetical protein [Ruegeria lacuscaerulensis]|uniref:hypothetical protein n=1 Tax=Ruegeria lacuscaerulensis TaxID=55218 RepID=UPI00147B7411|nr:hypothetical protein [Ruegeria lacuscaerulensis]
MAEKTVQKWQLQRPLSLTQRIADLQARKPEYINHGQALLLQRTAAASLREQVLADDRISLGD